MNCVGDECLYPAQVFAQFTSRDGKTSNYYRDKKNIRANKSGTATGQVHHDLGETNVDSGVHNRDEIHIYESGEVSLPPDHAKVVIVCSNIKVFPDF